MYLYMHCASLGAVGANICLHLLVVLSEYYLYYTIRVLSEYMYYQRQKQGDIQNFLKVTKYYHTSNSIPTMVFKTITVQYSLRVATAVTIQKPICGIEWDIS